MGITLFTGLPGSGKTYKVVHELAKKQTQEKYMIFHNVDGLKLEGEFVKDWRSIPGFLGKAKQQEICDYEKERSGRPVLVVIDEAQNDFDKSKPELKSWLSWHRHLGQDIWLICQHNTMIHRDYYNLCDFEVRGKKGLALNQFLYQYEVRGEKFKTERIPKKIEIFQMYRSFEGASAPKKGFKVVHYAMVVMVVAIVGAVYFLVWGVPGVFGANDKKAIPTKVSSGSSTLPRKMEKGKVGPSIEDWSCCGLMGKVVMLCNDQGEVKSVDDAVMGAKLQGIGQKEVKIRLADGTVKELKIGQRRARRSAPPEQEPAPGQGKAKMDVAGMGKGGV